MQRISAIGVSATTIHSMIYNSYISSIYMTYVVDGNRFLARINPSTLSTITYTFMSSQTGTDVYGMDSDSNYLFVSYYSYAYTHRLLLDLTLSKYIGKSGNVRAIKLLSSGNLCYGYEGTPAKIEIRNKDLTVLNTLNLATGEDHCFALATDGTYVYAGTSSSPARIVKILAANASRVMGLTLSAEENSCVDLVYSNGYLYACLQSSTPKIVKIDPVTMTKVSTLTFPEGNNSYARLVAGKDGWLYAAINNSPTTIVKINPNTMSVAETINLNAGEVGCTAFVTDGDEYLYVSTRTSPVSIVKVSMDGSTPPTSAATYSFVIGGDL